MTKPRPPLEREILADIRAVFARIPWVTMWRQNVGEFQDRNGRYVQAGLCIGSADLVGIVAPHGRWIAIEVKRPGKKPTLEQLEFLRRIRDWGGVAGVAHSVWTAADLLHQTRGIHALTKDFDDVQWAIDFAAQAKARKRRPVRVA